LTGNALWRLSAQAEREKTRERAERPEHLLCVRGPGSGVRESGVAFRVSGMREPPSRLRRPGPWWPQTRSACAGPTPSSAPSVLVIAKIVPKSFGGWDLEPHGCAAEDEASKGVRCQVDLRSRGKQRGQVVRSIYGSRTWPSNPPGMLIAKHEALPKDLVLEQRRTLARSLVAPFPESAHRTGRADFPPGSPTRLTVAP